MLVEAFVAEPAVEGLDESVVDWFPRPDELELDAPAARLWNSGPLSTTIVLGRPRVAASRSSTEAND